jgi:hypothetical protein
MAKKKDRAFFVCPRWDEVVREARLGGPSSAVRVHAKVLAAIEDGRPVARSTLRKALVAVRQASGAMFDVDAYVVDQRVQSR